MNTKWTDDRGLRKLAEQALTARTRPLDAGVDRDALLHELLVHETELQMQNEALRDAQYELATSEERYRNLFEHAPTGYLGIDSAGRIEVANPRAAAILGTDVKRAIGVRLSKFLMEDEAIAFERHRREVLRSNSRLTAEFTLVSPEGRKREVRFESACMNAQLGSWLVCMTDVTAPNALARKLNHSERLGALGRHASGVAHDLKNLLFGMSGYADAALRALTPDDPSYTPVVQLRAVVQRCAAATDQLATYTRAETAQTSIIELNTAIAEHHGLFRSLLGDDIEIELSLAASDAAVRLDLSSVEQIVLSVVRNARQAMPQGGVFRVETASVELRGPMEVRGVTSARCVRWTMTDTGIGMNESTRQRAFEPFFTTKPAGIGTGLGLSMVSAAVERAGGVVTLESELGRGTNVIIYLPRATGFSDETEAAEAIGEAAAPSTTVMIVEDDPGTRERVTERLRRAGCEVVSAADSNEALALLPRVLERVCLVLIDENLPGPGLGDLLRAMRAISPKVQILVTPLGYSKSDSEDVDDTLSEAVLHALAAVQSGEDE